MTWLEDLISHFISDLVYGARYLLFLLWNSILLYLLFVNAGRDLELLGFSPQ